MQALVGGLRIIQSLYCTKRQQFRFPRSTRRRIRAKWAKREINFRHLPDPNMYVMRDQGAVVMHPATWRELERELSSANAPHQARAVASRPECSCSPSSSGGAK